MSNNDFNAVVPVVVPEVPAIPEKTYPNYWMINFRVSAPSPQQEASVIGEFVPSCKTYAEDGITVVSEELKPDVSIAETVVITNYNMFEAMREHQDIAIAFKAVLEAMKNEGIRQGKFI